MLSPECELVGHTR